MAYIVHSYLIILMEAVCCFLFFLSFCQAKQPENRIKKVVLFFILSISMCVAAMCFTDSFWMKEMLEIILITIFMLFFFYESVRKILFISIIFQGILICMDFFAVVIDSSIIQQRDETVPFSQMLLVILSKLMLFTIVIIINRVYGKKRTSEIRESDWIKFSVFPVFSICMIACLISSSKFIQQSGQSNLYWIIAFGLLAMNVVMFFLLKDIVKREEKMSENRLFAVDARNKIELYKKIMDKTKKQQSLSHEYKNQLACIQALSSRKKYDELDEYLNTICESVRHDTDFIDTNHTIVNAVLNEKFHDAMNKNILFIFKINDLSSIWLDDNDIVLLLSNLLNNAIEASEKCEASLANEKNMRSRTKSVSECVRKKRIKFKFVLDDDELILAVKNTYEGIVGYHENYIVSTKDGDAHGYGIKNVIRIIKKYNGEYNITYEDGEFSFVIIFPKKDF